MYPGRSRLLFLAYPFPPANMVSCVRTGNIAKYLARKGWQIRVVTPHPSLFRYVREEHSAQLNAEGVQRILTDHRWRCLVPGNINYPNHGLAWLIGGVCRRIAKYCGMEAEIGWIKAAEQACSMLTSDEVDVILATAPPFAAFTLAKGLAEKLACPYILDYRDPWSGNPVGTQFNRPAVIKKEAEILAGSAGATIVSESWRRAIEQRFGVGDKVHVLTNGYDPEELATVSPHDFGHSAIVYAGSLYPPKRSIAPIMAALSMLTDRTNGGQKWAFHYYGADSAHVVEEAKRFGISERVVDHGWVSRSAVLSAVRGAAIALVITSVENNGGHDDTGWITGKIFETIGLRTPFLAVAPAASDIVGITQTAGLGQTFTADDIPGMARFLADALNGNTPSLRNPEHYEWPNIVGQLDTILRQAIERRRMDSPRQTPVSCQL